MSSNSGVEVGWGEIMIMIVALIMLAMMPAISADNIAPATLSQHAIEKHGADAQRGWQDYQSGCRTLVYRNLAENDVLRLVYGSNGETWCIHNTTSGLFGTLFRSHKTVEECQARLARDPHWEFVGIENECSK